MSLKLRSAVREEFSSKGWSVSSWAKQHGYSAQLVHTILNDDDEKPRRPCLRGESHNIAVDLRIKQGQVSRPSNMPSFQLMGARA